jgi:hypothetical protein
LPETYTITAVSPNVEDVQLEKGPFKSYRLKMEGKGEDVFTILQKPDTAPPQVGQSFEASIRKTFPGKDGQPPLHSLKKESAQGSGYRPQSNGNSSGDSPETRSSIERQVAAKEASNLLVAMVTAGTYKPSQTSEVAEDHRYLANEIAKTIAGA